MAKGKHRKALAATEAQRRESWKSMTPEARKAWSLQREKTAQTGYAKRKRERANGMPMSTRTHESPPWWRFHDAIGGRDAALYLEQMERREAAEV